MKFGLVRGLSWRRLFLGTAGLVAQFQCRLFLLVQAGSFCMLPGGLGRFVPCDTGANHCRPRHIGWERCGHGLTSMLRESASEDFSNRLLVLLLLLYWVELCTFGIVLPGLLVSFPLGGFLTAVMFVSWSLSDRVLEGDGICRVSFPSSAGRAGVSCESRVLGGFKRIRLNRETPAHLARLGKLGSVSSRSRIWKRLRVSEARWCSICGSHVLHECHHSDDGSSLGDRVGVG